MTGALAELSRIARDPAAYVQDWRDRHPGRPVVGVRPMNFPRELEEAGRVDGLSYFGAFWRIVVPNSLQFYAAIAVITFISSWNAFLWPLVIGQDHTNRHAVPVVAGGGTAAGEASAGSTAVTLNPRPASWRRSSTSRWR